VTYNNNRASASTFMTNAMHTHIFWEHPVFTLEPIELSQGCWEDSASTHYQADKVERLGIICSTYNPRFVHLQVIRRVRFQQQATHHNFSPTTLPLRALQPIQCLLQPPVPRRLAPTLLSLPHNPLDRTPRLKLPVLRHQLSRTHPLRPLHRPK
jgi:hypothetical protein